MARPKYIPSEAHLKAVYEGAKKGLNQRELAFSIGISETCFKKNKHLFAPHIKKGKDEGDPETIKLVKSALIKRALGYDFTEKHIKKVYPPGKGPVDGDSKGTTTETKAVKKFIAPSVAAAIFYLCNMDKENWRNVSQIDHTVKNVGDIRLALMSMPEKLLKEICKHLGMDYEEILNG